MHMGEYSIQIGCVSVIVCLCVIIVLHAVDRHLNHQDKFVYCFKLSNEHYSLKRFSL